MQGARIAVIEDDAAIAQAVAARLRAERMHVDVAADGPSGVELCRGGAHDLVVLDWMLPGYDGAEVLRRLRTTSRVPVIFLTARAAETDLVVGLGLGADDYVTKPFSPRELVARIQALLRRAGADDAAPGRHALGALTVDLDARRVSRDGVDVALTPTELGLLEALVREPGRAFTRSELLERVWDWRGDGDATRTVDTHVAALRRKLGHDVVRTVQGHGYALGDPA